MHYFSDGFNDFFKGLAPNNNKDWFHENKKIYEREVKKPFDKFLTDLIANIKEKYDANLDLEVKNAKFRINRDIRFAKDKSPYKMQVSAIISPYGRKDMQIPGMYVQLGVGELWFGGGSYKPDKENLQKIRSHIANNLESFASIIEDKNFKKYYPKGIQGEANKRIPKEFKAIAEQQPLIANKQFYFMAEYDDEQMITADNFMETVLLHYQAGMNFNNFLKAAIK